MKEKIEMKEQKETEKEDKDAIEMRIEKKPINLLTSFERTTKKTTRANKS